MEIVKALAAKLMHKLHGMTEEQRQYVNNINCMSPKGCTKGNLLSLQEIEKSLGRETEPADEPELPEKVKVKKKFFLDKNKDED